MKERTGTKFHWKNKKMAVVMEGLGRDLKKTIKLQDLSSDFKNYFLKLKKL